MRKVNLVTCLGLGLLYVGGCGGDSSLGSGHGSNDELRLNDEQKEPKLDDDSDASDESPEAKADDTTDEDAADADKTDADNADDAIDEGVDDSPGDGEGGEASTSDDSADDSSDNSADDEAGDCGGYESFTAIDYAEFDTSSWQSEASCQQLAQDRAQAATASVQVDVSALAGTWRELSGGEPLELILDATGHGTLRYGEVDALPAIEDASEAYLVDAPWDGPRLAAPVDLRSGYTYEIRPVAGAGSELTFGVLGNQPWQDWCELQTPMRGNECYACEAGVGVAMNYVGEQCQQYQGCHVSQGMNWYEVDCDRAWLCLGAFGVCHCTSDACAASTAFTTERSIALDPVDAGLLRVPDRQGSQTLYLERVE